MPYVININPPAFASRRLLNIISHIRRHVLSEYLAYLFFIDIERIKMLHSLKRVTHEAAKSEIKQLESRLLEHVSMLPEHEQHIYMLRKEFGKEF